MDPTNYGPRKKLRQTQIILQGQEGSSSSTAAPSSSTTSTTPVHMPEIFNLEIPTITTIAPKRLLLQKPGEKDYQWIRMAFDTRHDFFWKS